MASNNASAALGALKATLVGGTRPQEGQRATPSISASVRGYSERPLPITLDLDDTMGAEGAVSTVTTASATTVAGRTTVLPRRNKTGDAAPVVAGHLSRFERVRLLGEGAMGQVELARDNDIRRTVAVKRIAGHAATEAALLRFADEVRIVGQLEHPGIVPVYDVGRDESGQVYLVMKHLHGETMEDIVSKLRAGEPGYAERFTTDYRIHLFLGVLDAVRYAHSRGIVHRDLKPANVQIGPYGEVTVMDWGIAKPFRRGASASAVEPLNQTLVEAHDQRLLETKMGSLAGTPLYMSPEQAAGRNDDIDDRSDVYALSVLLYEWLALEHPIQGKTTVMEVLATVIAQDYDGRELFSRARHRNVPVEYIYIAAKGMARDRTKRFQSVDELEREINRARDGFGPVQCHLTLGKRVAYGMAHFIDRHFVLYSLLFFGTAAGFVLAIVFALLKATRVWP
jgi:serine/threonine-protein kinase